MKASTDKIAVGKTYGNYNSLSKREKIKLILKQMRTSLAEETNGCARTVGNKTNALNEEGTYMELFFEFTAEYHSDERNMYKLSRDYHAAYAAQVRMMATSGNEDRENGDNEETKENDDSHKEERWMSSLRAAVLFLALSPHTPQQNETLRCISMDTNLEKTIACYDIVHTLLRKHPTQNILSHQSKMQHFKSISSTVDKDTCMIDKTSGWNDNEDNQYSCIRSGLSGGTIARIGRRFTTSVLGIQQPTPILALSIRNNCDDCLAIAPADFGVYSDAGECSDGCGFQAIASHKFSHGIMPPQVGSTPQDDEQQKKLEPSNANEKRRPNKQQILMQKKSIMLGILDRLRHHSLSSIPNDGTRIIDVFALQTSSDSLYSASLKSDINNASSECDVTEEAQSSRITEDVNQRVNTSDSNHNLRQQQTPCTQTMELSHDEDSSIPQQSPGLSPTSPVTTMMQLRSPQQSLWLKNAIQYENKGNYASALYYYELCLKQVREMNEKWNGQNYDDKLKYNNEKHKISVSHAFEMTWLLHKVGVVRWKTGDYVVSLTPLLEATSSLRCFYLNSSPGSDNRKVYGVSLVEVLNSMGKIYLSRGEFQQARMFYEESYDVLNNAYVESLSNATKVRNCKGQEENEIMERSCKLGRIREEANETTSAIFMHPSLAQTIIAIGIIDDMQGKHSMALQKLRNGYSIQRKILCPDDVEIAATLNAIGSTYGKMGDYNRSMKYHKRALKLYTNQFGTDNVDVAVSRNNIGQMYHSLGNLKKALIAFTESFRVMKMTLGDSHRNVAAVQHNIALIHLEHGEYDEALLIFKDVLKSQRKALGDDHMDVALTLESIGDAYERKGRFDRGIKLYQKALRIRRKGYGENHLYVAATLDRIGKYLMMHGNDLKEAMRRFHEALNLYYHNGLTNDDEKIILARANLQKIRNNLKLDAVRGEST